nr:O-antigen translocase [Tamlana agarivorans]
MNAISIAVKLMVSIFVQRILAVTFGEIGIAKVGQIRNLINIITSTSSLGTLNGVVKYVAEFKEDQSRFSGLFSTAFIFVFTGSIISSGVLLFSASHITMALFDDLEFLEIIRLLALFPFAMGLNMIFLGVINGLSEYKKYTLIDLLSYLLSTVFILIGMYVYGLKGVICALVVSPLLQLVIILCVSGKGLKKIIAIKELVLKVPYVKEMAAFALMSFVSTVVLNYIELNIRTLITEKISIEEAGYWTAMSLISQNYMSFASGLFTLYVIPKFARIYNGQVFKKEVLFIYTTILPIFGTGMLLVYVFRNLIISIVYPNFTGIEPMFKWQLLGDFVRLASWVVAHQFLAKKMVKSFIFTELLSLGLFYFLSKYLVVIFGSVGVVMAHLYRCIIYFVVVIGVVWYYYSYLNDEKPNHVLD